MQWKQWKRSAGHPPSRLRRRRRRVALCAAFLFALISWAPLAASARAAIPPEQDPFYRYEGATPLADIAPGTVLKTRVGSYHVAGIALPVIAVQLLYRTTGQLGQPTVNVTSVLEPPLRIGPPTVVSYQSAYDSLNTEDDPSYAISGGPLSLGSLLPNLESVLIAPALLAGETVVVPDTEGENADFAAGPEYGMNTLDSLRAALSSPAAGIEEATKIGLIGYSGGAIATEWAAELAPSYAPEVNSRIVGAAMGGVLVDPAHNLIYDEGSTIWAGVIPMALIGVARSFHDEITPYLSEYGKQLYEQLQRASIVEVLGAYPGLTWSQLSKPEYPTPESIPVYVHDANQLIMGTHGTPTVPLFIGQGAGGELEGTAGDKPGIGRGDGVMIAGDVRSLAREYCARGATVQYVEYEDLSHILAAVPWLVEAAAWLAGRFGGESAPEDCGQIPPGNSLAPLGETTTGTVAGRIGDKRLGEPIVLPSGSRFAGEVALDDETGTGTVHGGLSVPPFAASLRLFGGLRVTIGMNVSAAGALEGTVTPGGSGTDEETLQLPAKLDLGVTSISLLGLTIPTACKTAEPMDLQLSGTYTREQLLSDDWSFLGETTVPRFTCEGGLLGSAFSYALTALLSGPGNLYTLSVAAP